MQEHKDSTAHFLRTSALRSSRPSGLLYCTRSPILPFIFPQSVSGSPEGSVASRVRVSAVNTKLEFCKYALARQLPSEIEKIRQGCAAAIDEDTLAVCCEASLRRGLCTAAAKPSYRLCFGASASDKQVAAACRPMLL